MTQCIYPIISILYLSIPVLAIALAIVNRRRTGRRRPVRVLLRTCTTGAVLGAVAAMLYASLANAQVPWTQVAMGAYVGMAALCVVAGLNWLLYQLVRILFRLNRSPRPASKWPWRYMLAGLVQAALLLAVGLPYLGSVLLLYRPKAPTRETPVDLIGAPYEVADFRATDGVPLEGWWIPATRSARTDGFGSVKWGRDTVLLCHGFGADKGSQLFLARDLVANGYNVLAIDLRAHGRSGGQFTGFGSVESRDVIGAIRWLQRTHGSQCNRILGLGESLGAVALMEAAADPGPEGQAIGAIAAYNPYNEFSEVLYDAAKQHMLPASRWALIHAIVPVASAQLGTNLSRFSPATAVRALWPRPILILGNSATREIPGQGAYDVFESALQPKYAYFQDDADRQTLLNDKHAAKTVRIFFDEEQSIL